MNPARAKTALLIYGCVILTAVILSIHFDIRSIWETMGAHPFGKTLLWVSQILFGIYTAIFIWRIYLSLKYRPAIPCMDEELPLCTVIVPAYNEGRQVFDTILSIAQSDYPQEKMEILGVDDGSSDDTWNWLCEAEKALPGRVRLFKQPVNKGKREALYLGFEQGQGEVYVTIDSDSVLEPQTLRNLVSPMVRDKRVGAVAGNVRILNQAEGWIPKMLDVSFAFSFDFIRAGQSVVNAVLCTPGALSGYRKEAVVKVLDEWVHQTFMGKPANIGEDRAMTNLILRSGYFVRYQRDAVVHTLCPVTLVKLWKMLLRWARSNIRESIVIGMFAFRHFRQEGALGLRINVIGGLLALTIGQVMHLMLLGSLVWMPLVVGPKMIMGAAVASLAPGIFYAIRYRSNKAIWALPYSFMWMVYLSWITLYATVTPHKNGWMTRDLNAKKVAWASSSDKDTFVLPS